MLRIGFCFFTVLLILNTAVAQVQTARFTSMNSNTNAYYEYLPQGYNSGTQKYPLILFIHGAFELGEGNAADLPKLLDVGLPRLISVDSFPNSFNVNGQNHSFIVISPQFKQWPSALHIKDVLDYVVANYRVNLNRVYVTGMSMGGGLTWEFAGLNATNAGRIAAIVPVAGQTWADAQKGNTIGDADLPVWATHNDGDPLVSAQITHDMVNLINARNPTPLARKTIYNSPTHDAWSTTYDPEYRENGLNIYEWMLQYQRAIVPLPVKISGYTAVKLGNRVKISWATTSEINNHHFTIERSANGRDFQLLGTVAAQNQAGQYSYVDEQPLPDNFYRLSQTDNDGQVTYFETLQVRMDEVQSQLVISPNPFVGELTVKINGDETGNFQGSLMSPSGTVLRQWTFRKSGTSFMQNLSLEGLPAGTYFFRLRNGTFLETRKLVKAR